MAEAAPDRWRWLRYRAATGRPFVYRLRMATLALAPLLAIGAFRIDPRDNWLNALAFVGGIVWCTVIYGFALRELWRSIWRPQD